jgi:hypothetical protein
MAASDRDARRSEEAERVLAAVDRDSEALGTSRLAAMADRTVRHFSAGDRPAGDPAEVWGTRIGRIAGLAAFIGLAVYLLLTYVVRWTP